MRGPRVWRSDAWRAEATAWLDARLADAGRTRTGPVEQPHVRPWSTVLRAPTDAGAVFLKAPGGAGLFEVPLYAVLARTAPERVLVPLAADPDRGWLLLPDGGPSLGDRVRGPDVLAPLGAAVAAYGTLQRRLAPEVDALLAAGVRDMRPAVLPARLDEALAAVRAIGGELAADVCERVAADRARIEALCAELAASPLAASLDHNDLHPWNVLDGPRFYDWGDSVVAHPFAAVLVPLQIAERVGGEEGIAQVRDAYLTAFADAGPRAELVRTLETACRVAKIARTLTWTRLLDAAGDEGAHWADAPLQTLAALLDPAYVGGA